MSAILYGNLSVEIASRHGSRVTRTTLRQNPVDLLRPQRPDALARPPILGREQQSADAFHAIQQGSSIEFHADCGYGKTTLLQHIAASASEWYSASSCIYLRADRGRVEDLLQHLVDQLYSADQPVKLTPESARSYCASRASSSPSTTPPPIRRRSAICLRFCPDAAW
jgi:hypothetical protein